MSKEGNRSVWLGLAAVGGLAVVGAGAWYLYKYVNQDDECDDDAPETLGGAVLQLARLHTDKALSPATPAMPARPAAAPALPPRPVRATPASTARQPVPAAASSVATTNSTTEIKLCDNCTDECSAPLLRCSRCKAVYYCGPECQRTAWQQHKEVCRTLSGSNRAGPGLPPRAGMSGRAGRPQQPASGAACSGEEARQSTSISAPSTDAEISEGNGLVEEAGTSTQQAGDAPADVPREATDAELRAHLFKVLNGEVRPGGGELDEQLQDAVFSFIHGGYRRAEGKLKEVAAAAAKAGEPQVEGDALRWLGHTFKQLVDHAKAVDAFERSHVIATSIGNMKLQVDALSGLGCMYRAAGEVDKAVEYHEKALKVAEQSEEVDSRASVLTNLGAALSTKDPIKAASLLQEAVDLREAQVIRIHEAGGEPAALARALMEHASALVNLASALMASQQVSEAEQAFLQSLQVFEMIQDVDKVSKVLINLANMTELQNKASDAKERAALYRQKLFEFVDANLDRKPPSSCAVCLEDLDVQKISENDRQSPIVLGCLHCFHNHCWEEWTQQSNQCPECKAPVTLL